MSESAWFRILTAEGRGAIAVISVRGPDAARIVHTIFRPRRGSRLLDTAPGRLTLGRAGAGLGDEVVAVRLESPTPTVELQCHGGPAAVAAVVQALRDAGASPDELRPRTTASVEERISDQALEDLASAPTVRVAEILLDQVHGAFGRALARLIADAEAQSPLAAKEIERLIRVAEVGVRLLHGWKIVIAGRPNVGKSRLFNALAGFDRSIVNSQPGVTRDVVTFRTAFEGWPVQLADTAGERTTDDAIEDVGIRKSRQERQESDLTLLVLDRSEPLQETDWTLLHATGPSVVVANKCDLPAAWDIVQLGGLVSTVCPVSAETGEGLGDFMRALGPQLVPKPPPPGAEVPFRADHLRGLEAARTLAIAADLHGAAVRLREIASSDHRLA